MERLFDTLIYKCEILTGEEGLRDCDEWNFQRGTDVKIRRIIINRKEIYFCHWIDLRGNNIYIPTATPPNMIIVAAMSGFYLYSNAKLVKSLLDHISKQKDKKAFNQRLRTLLLEGRPR